MKKIINIVVVAFAALAMVSTVEASETYNEVAVDRYDIFYEWNQTAIKDIELEKLAAAGKWLKANSDVKVVITGWADSERKESSSEIAKDRAMKVKNYLMRNFSIASDRMIVRDGGVDTRSVAGSVARRVDISEIKSVAVAVVEMPKEAAMSSVEFMEMISAQPATKSTQTVSSYAEALKFNVAEVDPFVKSAYFGVGVGTTFAVSTFSTVGHERTTPRVSSQIFGGYEFSKMFSAELGVGYTNLYMTTGKGTKNYYIAEGQAVYIPSPDAEDSGDYAQYSDLKSKSNLISVEARFNINLMALSSYKSNWGLLLTPKVGYAYSDAVIEIHKGSTDQTFQSKDQTASHAILGLDFSGEYAFNKKTSLRLTTGVSYLTGKGIDGVPQVQYDSNYTWTTTVNFVYRLGK